MTQKLSLIILGIEVGTKKCRRISSKITPTVKSAKRSKKGDGKINLTVSVPANKVKKLL